MKSFIYEYRIRRVRRSVATEPGSIYGPADLADMFRRTIGEDGREKFVAFFLDATNSVIGYEIVAIGHLHGVNVHPREVFRSAIIAPAAAIVVAHNHPSGKVQPSADDVELTARLKNCGELLGIPVLDSIIVAENDHFSFHDEGGL